MFGKTIKILAILLIMVTIFMFSMDTGEESTTKSDELIIRISETILHRKLSEKEKEEYITRYVVPIRKTAHFTMYFLLGLFTISLLNDYNLINKKLLIYTIVFVFIYACSDEIHQLLVPDRSGEVLDVLIDTLGGTTASLIYLKTKNRRKKYE